MRAGEDEARTAYRRHAHEVVGAAQEGCEGRCERPPPAHLETDCRRDELLLGDVHLEEPVGMSLAEDLGEGRVRHLAVERDDVAPCRAHGGESFAVRLACGHVAAELVAWELERARREAVRLSGLRFPHVDSDVALAAELGDGCVGVVERLAVEPVLVLDRLHTLALHGARDDNRRLALGLDCLRVRAIHLVDVVAVDGDRVPSERLGTGDVLLDLPAHHRLAALAEAVHVEDRGQVVELVVRRVLERLPHRSLGELAVTAQHPHPIGEVVEVLPGDPDADADRQPLPERSGGHVDPREDGRRVPLEPAAERPVRAGARRARSRLRRGTSRRGASRRGPSRR